MSASQTKKKPAAFKAGQEIVYPLQGVGTIQKIEEREFQGNPMMYYVIYLEVSDMTVMVPIDRAEELGIRAIVSAKDAEHAMQLVGEASDPIPADWKMRYQMNLDLLKEGSVSDIARVVRSLYHRSKIKELPILERKLFDSALTLLVAETASALGKTKKEMEEAIFTRLESEKPELAEDEEDTMTDDLDEDLEV
ncbi:CarD family transcriptional regulator [Spirochaeta africana]|uniref:CarD-like transcriptional regulator n=1 Tax=Spirochaeta africana (strain ATCC 700263 / DSM 8902 / Z-7692) TaxID=889378 RepID=H9UMD3_SPIAZ|nr:CarD family transcriptional regulator [Spirochaeta africana]AFG38676.1 CarD-like transcriptional regulator [Spirochaeta africana DSM 8902]